MPLPLMRPQPLVRIPEAFNNPAWLWELKLDGFRALAYVENGECRLISRNGHTYRTFDPLQQPSPCSCLRDTLIADPPAARSRASGPLAGGLCAPCHVAFHSSDHAPRAALVRPSAAPRPCTPRASRIGFSGSTPARQGSSLRSDPDKAPQRGCRVGGPAARG